MTNFLIKLIYFLVYLLSHACCQLNFGCPDLLQSINRERFMIDDYETDHNIIHLNSTYMNVFGYNLKSSFNLEVNFLKSVPNVYVDRFYYGQVLKKNYVIEGLQEKVSIIIPYDQKDFAFTRLDLDKRFCKVQKQVAPTAYEIKLEDESIASFLASLCEVIGKNVNLYALKRDDDEYIAFKFNDDEETDQVITILPNNTRFYLDVSWQISNKTFGGGLISKSRIHLGHVYKSQNIQLPEIFKDFFKDALYISFLIRNRVKRHLVVIRSKITHIYQEDETHLLDLVQRILKGKDVSNIGLPVLIDYFPNNYWYGCSLKICDYTDMDVIMNIGRNDLDLIAIKNNLVYKLKSNEDPNGAQLNGLTVSDSQELKTYLESLIKKNYGMELYDEFINLKSLDAADYLSLNDSREVLFFVKDNFVYQLFTKDNLSQKLVKSELTSFFSDRVSKSYIQSVFTIPNENRLVLVMDVFLICYSYSNFIDEGLVELSDEFEIKSTFEFLKASFTYQGYTYMFSKRFYQVFSTNDYNGDTIQIISGNFFSCSKEPILVVEDITTNLLKYNHQQSKHANIKPSSVPKNISFKFIVQMIIFVAVTTIGLLLFSFFYIKKYQKRTHIDLSKKEYDKKSFSGSSANLSTLFNLAKSTSDKHSQTENSVPKPSKLSPSKLSSSKLKDIKELKEDLKTESTQSKYTPVTKSQTKSHFADLKKKFFVKASASQSVRKSSVHSSLKSYIQEQSNKSSIKNISKTKLKSNVGSKLKTTKSKIPKN